MTPGLENLLQCYHDMVYGTIKLSEEEFRETKPDFPRINRRLHMLGWHNFQADRSLLDLLIFYAELNGHTAVEKRLPSGQMKVFGRESATTGASV